VGRLLGTAAGLSHRRAGRPFYYVETLAMYGLPWVPLILIWLGEIVRGLWKRHTLSPAGAFLLVWGLGSILLLSLSVTKRSIYVAPVLPAFAIMCAQAIQGDPPRWCRAFFVFWPGLCVVVLAVLAASPLAAHFLPKAVPADIADFLGIFALRNVVWGIGLAVCVCLTFQRGLTSVAGRLVAFTAILYIGLFAVPVKAIDLQKSMGAEVDSFVARIPSARRPHVAGWQFTETMRGCFYYYCGWSVPQITDEKRLRDIVMGQDRQFDSVIIPYLKSSVLDRLKLPYRIVAEGYPGASHHRRGVLWVAGVKDAEKDAAETGGKNGP